jgi:hypothetical protein
LTPVRGYFRRLARNSGKTANPFPWAVIWGYDGRIQLMLQKGLDDVGRERAEVCGRAGDDWQPSVTAT